MGSSEEQRKHPRKEIELGILFKQGMEWYPAMIKDLAEGGLSFETSMPAKPGDWCHIYFSESQEVKTAELKAEVVRSEVIEGSSPVNYLVAVKLIDVDEQYLQDVQSIFQIEGPNSN